MRIEAAQLRSRSKNTPFDGWELRGGVAATIVGGRTVFVNPEARPGAYDAQQGRIREKALKDLQQYEVLMLNGHFDFGNGYHGSLYLNPHQLFRYPSTIWRFAQDLLDVLPASIVDATEVVAGPVTGGALLATPLPDCSTAGAHHASATLFAPFTLDAIAGRP